MTIKVKYLIEASRVLRIEVLRVLRIEAFRFLQYIMIPFFESKSITCIHYTLTIVQNLLLVTFTCSPRSRISKVIVFTRLEAERGRSKGLGGVLSWRLPLEGAAKKVLVQDPERCNMKVRRFYFEEEFYNHLKSINDSPKIEGYTFYLDRTK